MVGYLQGKEVCLAYKFGSYKSQKHSPSYGKASLAASLMADGNVTEAVCVRGNDLFTRQEVIWGSDRAFGELKLP